MENSTIKECIEKLLPRAKNGQIVVTREEFNDYAKFFPPYERTEPMTLDGNKLIVIKNKRI